MPSAPAYSIRRAEPRDAAAAALLVRRSITELCVVDHRHDPETLREWLANKTEQQFTEWIAADRFYCVVAQAESVLCGVGLVERDAEIHLCYVAPGMQGRGIGRALVTELERQAIAWSLPSVRLKSTLGARRFYERNGYLPSGPPVPGFGITIAHPYSKQLSSSPHRKENLT